MVYCENGDLRAYIDFYKKSNNKKISQDEIILILLEICKGLKEIHKRNIIHRDLKPENIFIDKDFKIKIGDFGIYKQLNKPKEYATSFQGTSNYLAPEILNKRYNNKVDIWALGCIIYELCTLEFCFDNHIALVNQTLNKEVEKKIDKKYYSSELQELINLLLKKNYKERPDIEKVYDMAISLKKKYLLNEINLSLLLSQIDIYKKKSKDNTNIILKDIKKNFKDEEEEDDNKEKNENQNELPSQKLKNEKEAKKDLINIVWIIIYVFNINKKY